MDRKKLTSRLFHPKIRNNYKRRYEKDAARDSLPLQSVNRTMQLQNDSTIHIIGKYSLFANDTSFRESFLDAERSGDVYRKKIRQKFIRVACKGGDLTRSQIDIVDGPDLSGRSINVKINYTNNDTVILIYSQFVSASASSS